MIDIGPTNGEHPRRLGIHVTAATVGAIASTLGILIYAIGFVSGYLLLREHVTTLESGNVAMVQRLDALSVEIVRDRETLSSRLTTLEAKADYTAQGIADLKALTAGTRR